MPGSPSNITSRLFPARASSSAARKNKAALLQAIDHWNGGNLDQYLELYDPDIGLHGFPAGLPPGAAGAKVFYEGLLTAFPNPRLTLDDVITEGDKIACRFHMEATHEGEFMGIPRTGNEVSVTGATILQFSGGKCVERWNEADMMGWMQQIGAIPSQ